MLWLSERDNLLNIYLDIHIGLSFLLLNNLMVALRIMLWLQLFCYFNLIGSKNGKTSVLSR